MVQQNQRTQNLLRNSVTIRVNINGSCMQLITSVVRAAHVYLDRREALQKIRCEILMKCLICN